MKRIFFLVILIFQIQTTFPQNIITEYPKGGTVYGRIFYDSSPLSLAHIFVTDEKIKKLYGECRSMRGLTDGGNYTIPGLPANEKLKIFVLHETIPGLLSFDSFTLDSNQVKKMNFSIDLKWKDPGISCKIVKWHRTKQSRCGRCYSTSSQFN